MVRQKGPNTLTLWELSPSQQFKDHTTLFTFWPSKIEPLRSESNFVIFGAIACRSITVSFNLFTPTRTLIEKVAGRLHNHGTHCKTESFRLQQNNTDFIRLHSRARPVVKIVL